MIYEVFPFGKYKGYYISNIETTYIVYALETFDLPYELKLRLKFELTDRLDIPSYVVNEYEHNVGGFAKVTFSNDSGGIEGDIIAKSRKEAKLIAEIYLNVNEKFDSYNLEFHE